MTNEETKAKLINIWQKSTSVINKRNLKKCAGAMVIVAVFGSGASYVVHQNKAEAKRAASVARTELLQNMAAQEGRHVLSTQEAQAVVARVLKAEPSAISFNSVNLLSKQEDKDHKEAKDHHKKEGREQKEHSKKIGAKTQQFMQLYQPEKNREKLPAAAPQEQKSAAQPVQTLPEQAQQPQTIQPGKQDQPAASVQVQKQQPKAEPLFYQIKCTKDKVQYKFLLNAEDGRVLASAVEAESAWSGFLDK